MPHYPNYPSQPRSGDLPTMEQVGPSDLRYSSGTGPRYSGMIDQRYGRNLAGSDIEVQDEKIEQAYAINELNLMGEMDDTQGNGMFDPPGTRGNIHPDAGVFTARYSLPGYLARERMYAESEVRDVTTGRPVVYVNGGAVAMDDTAQIAFLERGAYAPPKALLDDIDVSDMGFRSIANVVQNPARIPPATKSGQYPGSMTGYGAYGAEVSQPMTPIKMLAITGLVGLAAGALYAVMKK
jgi:hypothetical protein